MTDTFKSTLESLLFWTRFCSISDNIRKKYVMTAKAVELKI